MLVCTDGAELADEDELELSSEELSESLSEESELELDPSSDDGSESGSEQESSSAIFLGEAKGCRFANGCEIGRAHV